MSDADTSQDRRHGFTLVEIMITVAIVGLLAALALPSFAKARQTSLAKKCIENQRHICEGVMRYEMDTRTTLATLRNDGVALRNTLLASKYINISDAFECPASPVKDYDDIHLLYNDSDFINTICTINPETHLLGQ